MNDVSLPEGWALVTLGEIVSPSKEKTDPSERPDAAYLSLEHIESQTARIVASGKASDVESTKAVFHAGDVLYGKLRPYLNKVCIPDFDGICSTDILVFPNSPSIENRFFMRVLMQPEVVEYANHNSKGIQLPRISFDKLAELPLKLPPLAEQHRIVAKVEALLARVNAARQRLNKVPAILKRFRQSVLAAACSGRLTADWREENHSVESDLPVGWKMAPVSEVATVQNGRAFPSKQYNAAGVRLLRPGNLHVSGELSWTEKNTKYLPAEWAEKFADYILKAGDLLMNLTAQSLKDEFLGRVCINRDNILALLNQRICRFIPKASDVRSYLFIYFKSPLFRRYVDTLDTGSLIRHMHSKQVISHEFPLPPLDEQQEIVCRVEALFRLAAAIEKRVGAATARAEKFTQAILTKAFRGELVPTEAELARREGRDYQPASVLLERIRAERANEPGNPNAKSKRQQKQQAQLKT